MGWINSVHTRHDRQYYRDRYSDELPRVVRNRRADLCDEWSWLKECEAVNLKARSWKFLRYNRECLVKVENKLLELDATQGGGI